jgi:hypothetical protein
MAWLLENLPIPLRTALVHGSEGAGHLARCAGLAAGAGLGRLAGELLLAAWAESPLDAGLAGQAAGLEGASAAARVLAAHVAEHSAAPAELSYYRRLVSRRDLPKIRVYLIRQGEKEPGNLFWDRLSLAHALEAEDWDWAARVSARLPEPLARILNGDAAMFRRDAAQALAEYSRAMRLWECPGIEARLGMAHLLALDQETFLPISSGPPMEVPKPRHDLAHTHLAPEYECPGHEAQAARWLLAGLEREPWRTQTLLALYDLLFGRRGMRRAPEGRVEALLYTYNKAQDIDSTLASLFASNLGETRVTVLDNGGTDATADVLAAWRERTCPDRLRTVSLPVNVGAPAARNWLASLPQVRESDWAVFLDDDVSLPPDWLTLLGAAARLYPGAGVWGARVLDHSRPTHIQSADVFLIAPPAHGAGHGAEPGVDANRPDSRRFTLSSCHHQTLDRGQFAYVRPCATVTGCCHLFRTKTLASMGGFDLRYSPSQYDDLDHDIRLLLAGVTPVCQGHLAVGHLKSTGGQGGVGQSQYGVGFANQYKLHQKFDAECFRRAARLADETAWEDALAKWRDVASL